MSQDKSSPSEPAKPAPLKSETPAAGAQRPVEIGGAKGPDPTRYGDWERNGRCVDF